MRIKLSITTLLPLFMVALLFTLIGCANTVTSSGPIEAPTITKNADGVIEVINPDPISDGYRYYLSKDIITVTSTKTTTTKIEYGDNLLLNDDYEKTVTNAPIIKAENEKDTSAYYTLDLSVNWLLDSSLTIATEGSGILKSISGDSKGEAGDVLANTLSTVASVVATAGALKDISEATIQSLIDNSPFANGADIDKLARLSPAEIVMVLSNEVAFNLYNDIDKLRKAVKSAKDKILENEIASMNLNGLDKLKNAKEVSDLHRVVLNRMQAEKQSLSTQWDSIFAAFKKDKKLGISTKTTTFIETFDLNELPPLSLFKPGLSIDQVNTVFINNPTFNRIKQLFVDSGLILTATPQNAEVKYSKIKRKITEKYSDQAVIFYRQTEPVQFKGYVMDSENDADSLKLIHTETQHLIRPGPATTFLAYDEGIFTDHKMTLTFSADKNGVLTKVERVTKSAAGQTESLAKGIKAVSGTLKDVSANMATYQDNQRKIAAHDLTLEKEELLNQKSVLDAKIALDAGTASEVDLIEKTRLDNQLAALKSKYTVDSQLATQEFDLEKAKMKAELDTLTGQLNLAKAQGTYDLNLETSVITLQNALQALQSSNVQNTQTGVILNEIELIKQQIALMKLQSDLEVLKNPPKTQ